MKVAFCSMRLVSTVFQGSIRSEPYYTAMLVGRVAEFQALLQGVSLEMKILRTSSFIADQVALHSPHHEETPGCSTALAAGAVLRRSGGQFQCQ